MKRSGPIKPSKILPRKVYPTRSRPKMTPERKAARNQPCLLNVANVCNYNAETTVLAHLRWLGEGAGIGRKPGDHCAVYACSACHDWLDGRVKPLAPERYESERNFYGARALARMRLLDKHAA
jgi:hypothetical protein